MVSKFLKIPGYNQHTFTTNSTAVEYIFVKYMDRAITSSEYRHYFVDQGCHHLLVSVFQDTFSSCPNKTTNPKMFSWTEVAKYCKNIFNGTLPEFLSRKDEEDFLSTVKGLTQLFPMEAVYIGTKKNCIQR